MHFYCIQKKSTDIEYLKYEVHLTYFVATTIKMFGFFQ